MILDQDETAMVEGKFGPGVQKSMEMLVKFGTAFGAEKMVRITSAHVIPNIPIELLEQMTEGIRHPAVFTSLHPHMSAFSPESWAEMGIAADYASRNLGMLNRRKKIFQEKGFFQTYTCFPAMVGNLPRKGDFISWIGSGGQVIVNSVLGARCNRDGAVISLAAAITGRAPYRGLFLDEERHAKVQVRLHDIDVDRLSQTELGAIGYFLGEQAQDRNVVIEGFSRDFNLDRLKYLMVPLSVTGAVGVCHIVGVTPEADTLAQALGDKAPGQIVDIDPDTIRHALARYQAVDLSTALATAIPVSRPSPCGEPAGGPAICSTPADAPEAVAAAPADVRDAGMVLFGCPHLSISEVRHLARLLEQRHVKPGKRLWVGFAHQQYRLAEEMGYVQSIEQAGGTFASACMSAIPDAPIPESVDLILTQSFKAAHYISRLTKGRVKVRIADMDACVDAITEPN